MKSIMVIGGAGFIGSNVVKRLLKMETIEKVVVYDNYSSGKAWHLEEIINDGRLSIVKADIKETEALQSAMSGVDTVISLASNPDIAKAMRQPDVDFWEGTYLINNIVEAMRITGCKRLLYASGSGVYGDVGATETAEDFSPLLPISTYGASKLACEALICSYCHMFDMNAAAFRFANVVGPNQTHGVGYDFLRSLKKDPEHLTILGDGTQSKSYIYVDDVISALFLVEKSHLHGFSYYNVGTDDSITVTEIGQLACEISGLINVDFSYTGGDRGWKGDVPVVRLNTQKIRSLGWKNSRTAKQAIVESMENMYKNRNIMG